MELYTINVDGSGLRQVTKLGGSNWAPFYLDRNHIIISCPAPKAELFLRDNRRIIFSSNFNATGEHFGAFDLYVINENGSGLERVCLGVEFGYQQHCLSYLEVTFNEGGFDAFPMMSREKRSLVWGSSRNGSSMMELNLFSAEWKKA